MRRRVVAGLLAGLGLAGYIAWSLPFPGSATPGDSRPWSSAGAVILLPAYAAEAAAPITEDDLDYGEEINEVCAGCHGEYGQGSTDGEYPRLAGLDAGYISRQIELFKSRERLNHAMLPYATDRELPADDVRAVAAFLEQLALPTALPPIDEANFNALARLEASKRVLNIARYDGDPAAGEAFYRRECASCHGDDGFGDRDKLAPPLAGQHSLYLLRQIENYRKGERLHEDVDDAEIFREFSDAEIGDMLAWLSLQDDKR